MIEPNKPRLKKKERKKKKKFRFETFSFFGTDRAEFDLEDSGALCVYIFLPFSHVCPPRQPVGQSRRISPFGENTPH